MLVPEQIVPIVCEPLADKQKPVATYGALFSLPFCAATNLVHGYARLDNFTEEALQNREVLATAAKIGCCVEPSPEFPNTFPGGIRLTLRDGRRLEWPEPINRGHPDNPMPADEVQDKFVIMRSKRYLQVELKRLSMSLISLRKYLECLNQ